MENNGKQKEKVMGMPTVVAGLNSGASRRTLYRQSKRVLTRLLNRRWSGPRSTLEPAVRRFLRERPRSFPNTLKMWYTV